MLNPEKLPLSSTNNQLASTAAKLMSVQSHLAGIAKPLLEMEEAYRARIKVLSCTFAEMTRIRQQITSQIAGSLGPISGFKISDVIPDFAERMAAANQFKQSIADFSKLLNATQTIDTTIFDKFAEIRKQHQAILTQAIDSARIIQSSSAAFVQSIPDISKLLPSADRLERLRALGPATADLEIDESISDEIEQQLPENFEELNVNEQLDELNRLREAAQPGPAQQALVNMSYSVIAAHLYQHNAWLSVILACLIVFFNCFRPRDIVRHSRNLINAWYPKTRQTRIVTREAKVFSSHKKNRRTLGTLNAGACVEIKEQFKGWRIIEYTIDGQTHHGWIRSTNLKKA
ncbi:MAG: hypothetical protein IT427_00320 [Pirellulales bacterium]|nr:hypothetical protein [Pirellulales bacterium]